MRDKGKGLNPGHFNFKTFFFWGGGGGGGGVGVGTVLCLKNYLQDFCRLAALKRAFKNFS